MAAELLGKGGVFGEAGGEPLSARVPDLRCLSTLGVGFEVHSDVKGRFDPGYITWDLPWSHVSAAPLHTDRLWHEGQREDIMFYYNISSFMLPQLSLALTPGKLNLANAKNTFGQTCWKTVHLLSQVMNRISILKHWGKSFPKRIKPLEWGYWKKYFKYWPYPK